MFVIQMNDLRKVIEENFSEEELETQRMQEFLEDIRLKLITV